MRILPPRLPRPAFRGAVGEHRGRRLDFRYHSTKFDPDNRGVLGRGPLIVGGSLSAGDLEATIEAVKVPYVGREKKKEIDPKLRDFVKRIFVPALVKRYISGLKQKRLLVDAAGNAS